MLRRLAVVGLLVSGCDRTGTVTPQIGEASTKPPETGPAAIIVSPPARQALAGGTAWLVDDGVTPLGTGVRKSGPALVVHFVDDARPILYNRLHRLAYHGRTAKFGRAFPVDGEDLEELGLEPPAASIWMFGPLGPCSATVGEPSLGRPSADVRVFEVSYALEGCGLEGRWAPFASTAVAMPKGVTWQDATTSEDTPFDDAQAWDHPLAAFADWPEQGSSFVAHARWVDAQPRPAQALVSAVSEGCGSQQHRSTSGWWGEEDFEAWDLPWLQTDDPPLLVGAVAWGGETAALVFDDGLDGVVAVVPGDEAEGQWSVQPLVAGRWSEADRDGARLRVNTCN